MLNKHDFFKSKLEDKDYFLEEVATATKTGAYSAYFHENKFFMDSIGRSILKIPDDQDLTLDNACYFFAKEQDLKEMLRTCTSGKSYEADVLMRSFDNDTIWMRFTSKPRYNSKGSIVGVRGIFTSIHKYITEQQELKRRSKIIEAQNQRLLHFAHIVSHNLRSHSSNLELTLDLFRDISKEDKSKVFYSYLDEISFSLSSTLNHLNQVVTLDTQSSNREVVKIDEVVQRVLKKHEKALASSGCALTLNFKAFSEIDYVEEFFVSIVDTLVGNAIRHRSAHKKLKLQLSTKIRGNRKLFTVKDNGKGIDLEKRGASLFNIYQQNVELDKTKGLGLFLIKNQVEALGGDITVKSRPDNGTKFTVRF